MFGTNVAIIICECGQFYDTCTVYFVFLKCFGLFSTCGFIFVAYLDFFLELIWGFQKNVSRSTGQRPVESC